MTSPINDRPVLPSQAWRAPVWEEDDEDTDIEDTEVENEGATPAQPAIPATPAIPASHDEQPATPAVAATPAVPAIPGHDESVEVAEAEEETPVVTERTNQRRSSLRRAGMADPNVVNFGQITSAQWALVHEFQKGNLTADNLKSQFLAQEKQKLDILVNDGKISADEEDRRIARFTIVVDTLIKNFS
jgi:hypothetical protein